MLFPLVPTFELPATVNTDKLAKYRALLIRIKQKLHKKRYQGTNKRLVVEKGAMRLKKFRTKYKQYPMHQMRLAFTSPEGFS